MAFPKGHVLTEKRARVCSRRSVASVDVGRGEGASADGPSAVARLGQQRGGPECGDAKACLSCGDLEVSGLLSSLGQAVGEKLRRAGSHSKEQLFPGMTRTDSVVHVENEQAKAIKKTLKKEEEGEWPALPEVATVVTLPSVQPVLPQEHVDRAGGGEPAYLHRWRWTC